MNENHYNHILLWDTISKIFKDRDHFYLGLGTMSIYEVKLAALRRIGLNPPNKNLCFACDSDEPACETCPIKWTSVKNINIIRPTCLFLGSPYRKLRELLAQAELYDYDKDHIIHDQLARLAEIIRDMKWHYQKEN